MPIPRQEEPEEGAPAWMVTFSDMTTLLLTFFVLIVAYSAIEEPRFGRAMGSLRGALGGSGGILLSDTEKKGSGGAGIVTQKSRKEEFSLPVSREEGKEITSIAVPSFVEFFKKLVKAVRKVRAQFGNVEVSRVKTGIKIRVGADVLFKHGSAKIVSSARPFLDMFADVLKSAKANASIEGHTDNVPVDERKYFGWAKGLERYSSNWDLSVARAVNVVEYLIKKGVDPKRLKAIGYADTRPIADNSSADGRKKNRRVVLFIAVEKEILDKEKDFIDQKLQEIQKIFPKNTQPAKVKLPLKKHYLPLKKR